MIKKTFATLICASLLLSGCATKPVTPEEIRAYEEANDPIEPFNRAMFATNMLLDTAILKPISKGYRAITPQPIRTGITNVFDNIKQPGYLVNSLLQGKGEHAWDISRRFLANTFLGLGGLFDVASDMNIPVHTNDFGQTLASWGWETSEPYIVWPILGPSNPRDTVGTIFSTALTNAELSVIQKPAVRYGIVALDAIQSREENIEFIDSLKNSSTDFYATVRSMYRQNRDKKIKTIIQADPQETNTSTYDFDFDEE